MSMHPGRNLFKEFKGSSRVFVETGSYRGDSIMLAIQAGFKHIISIDIDPECTAFCKSRLGNDYKHLKIELITGDSAECLYDAIKAIQEPITFWLDSHWQMLEGTEPGKNPFPLLDELSQIEDHNLNCHTILIDDMLIMQENIVGYSKTDIEECLIDINDQYTLRYFANPVIGSILVADELVW